MHHLFFISKSARVHTAYLYLTHDRFRRRHADAVLRVDGAKRGALKAQLVGIGAAAPKTRVSNAQLETVVETSDEWIAQRTGIRARHVLAPGEGLVELASDAVTQALEQAGVDPLEVELVIMATSTPGACCAAAAALRSFRTFASALPIPC